MKNIYYLIAISCIVFSYSLNAQWVQITGPNGANIQTLASTGINLFAGIDSMGIFVSTDDGNSWEALNNGLTNKYLKNLAVIDLKIFATTFTSGWPEGYTVIYSSTDLGANWQSETLLGWNVTCFAIKDSNVFAGLVGQNGGGGIARYKNDGESWEIVYTTPTAYSPVTSMVISDSNVFAGTGPYHAWFLRSSDDGNSWTVVGSSLGGGINALALSGENLFAGTYVGVFLSTDDGLNWTPVNNGLPDYVNNYGWITTLIVSSYNGGMYLFTGTDSAGVFLSTDNGTNWSTIGLSDNYVYDLTITDTSLFAVTYSGVWRRPLSDITGIEDQSSEIPSQYLLEQNYPNPFNPSTIIQFHVPIPLS